MAVPEFDAQLEQANERIRQETQGLKEQNHVLRDLLERRRNFAARLEQTLAKLNGERKAMDAEIRRLLSPGELKTLTAA